MKYVLIFILGILSTATISAQTGVENQDISNAPIVIEVKYLNDQKPMKNLRIRLSNLNAIQNKWEFLDEQVTNTQGMISEWDNHEINGLIEMKIYIADYFRQKGEESIFPYITVYIYRERLKSNYITLQISKDAYSIKQRTVAPN
ncbi:hydroxyisourate hydrolase [Prolixibacteraceae bacterium]|nr:hydroxyisourate hydrolase [Prolixibacteraceae bacterium]